MGGGFPGSPGRINVSYEAANHLSQSSSDRELRQILLSRAMLLLNYLALCWGDALIICWVKVTHGQGEMINVDTLYYKAAGAEEIILLLFLMCQRLYNWGNGVPPSPLHWASLCSSGRHHLVGWSDNWRACLTNAVENKLHQLWVFLPVKGADFGRHYQCHRQMRSITSWGLPYHGITEDLLMPRHVSRPVLRESSIRPVIYQ